MEITRHETSRGAWELAIGEPDRRLRGHVTAYHGYVEQVARPVRGWELPSTEIPLIINFGPAYRLSNAADPASWATHSSFVAGLHDVAACHESTGSADCLQVNFTPLGAYRFFGVAMDELVNRVVAFDDLLGTKANLLTERLAVAPSWEARFAIMDDAIAARGAAARAPDARVAWAWQQIERASGAVSIATLAEEIGWSRKHFVARFREQVGMPPKQVARLHRFQRVMRMLAGNDAMGWADLAHRCGYYDQSHLIRDVRQFAGCAPTELVRSRLDATDPVAT